jgi:hypothetical protein
VCFVVHKTTSELKRTILTTLFLLVQKTPIVGVVGRGICSMLFLWMFWWLLHRNSPLPMATTQPVSASFQAKEIISAAWSSPSIALAA